MFYNYDKQRSVYLILYIYKIMLHVHTICIYIYTMYTHTHTIYIIHTHIFSSPPLKKVLEENMLH